MNPRLLTGIACLVVALAASTAPAQDIYTGPSIISVQPQVIAAYPPVVVAQRPVVVYRATPVYPPVVTHRVIVPTTVVQTYRPVVPVYTAPATVVVPGPRVLVHPKVYVRGQPVRNVLRAVTP